MQNAEHNTSERNSTRPLTPKQVRFVEEYLVDLNGAQAAIRAGYSEKTASVIAAENLSKPYLSQAIQKAFVERSRRTQVTQDRVIREYARIAFSDIGSYVEWGRGGVRLKDSGEFDEDTRRAVSEVSETKTKDGGTVKFKLHDKVAALDALGKHLGMFPKDVRHSGIIEHTLPILPQPSGLSIEELREALALMREAQDIESKVVAGEYRELPAGEIANG